MCEHCQQKEDFIQELKEQLLHKERIINKQGNKIRKYNAKIQQLGAQIYKLQQKKKDHYVNKGMR